MGIFSSFRWYFCELSLSKCLKYSRPVHLTGQKGSEVHCLKCLCLARLNPIPIEGFSYKEINTIINCITLDSYINMVCLFLI